MAAQAGGVTISQRGQAAWVEMTQIQQDYSVGTLDLSPIVMVR